jgi:hypothetical protein
MSWYSIVVTPNEQTNGVAQELFDAFTATFIAQAAPEGAGMWLKRDNATGNVTYFLSPQGYAISRLSMMKFHPQPCGTPNVISLVPSVVRHS